VTLKRSANPGLIIAVLVLVVCALVLLWEIAGWLKRRWDPDKHEKGRVRHERFFDV